METKITAVPAPLKKSAKGGSASGGKTKKKIAMAKVMPAGRQAMPMPVVPSHGVCKTCSLLPVGSVELTSLLLVLVFSLVSVLFTAVFALNSQEQKIAELEELVANS